MPLLHFEAPCPLRLFLLYLCRLLFFSLETVPLCSLIFGVALLCARCNVTVFSLSRYSPLPFPEPSFLPTLHGERYGPSSFPYPLVSFLRHPRRLSGLRRRDRSFLCDSSSDRFLLASVSSSLRFSVSFCPGNSELLHCQLSAGTSPFPFYALCDSHE